MEPPRVIATPLTTRGFEGFGELIATPAQPGRVRTDEEISMAPDRRLVLSTTHARPTPEPIVVSELERHPHSSQTFLALDVARWLIVVSATLEPTDVRAFIAGPGIGVTIARGIWHHGLTVLDGSGHFAVLMAKDGLTDDEFAPVTPFQVDIPTIPSSSG